MNKMTKSLVMASSILLLGSNAYAAKALKGEFSHNARSTVIQTNRLDSKTEAYAVGLQTLNDLKAKTSQELNDRFGLNLRSPKEKSSVSIADGAYITVQELMDEQGNIVYQGAVNVTYHFSTGRND